MTGLFFGSFNPIHNGHLKIAQYLLYKGYCQRIWFVVSPHNPLKSDRSLLDEQKRLEIVKAAIRGDERMQACDVEFGLPKPSYTYATLQLLKKKWPEEEFALIIGEDIICDDKVAMILGDNIFAGHGFKEKLKKAADKETGATVFGYYVDDPVLCVIVELY